MLINNEYLTCNIPQEISFVLFISLSLVCRFVSQNFDSMAPVICLGLKKNTELNKRSFTDIEESWKDPFT